MKVTLAMGLQYEHSPKHPPTKGREDFSAHLKPAENIIDVKPIIVEHTPKQPLKNNSQVFDYITYNMEAGLVLIPRIGTHLNLRI